MERSQSDYVISSLRPNSYPQHPFAYCGAYSAKAILTAFGRPCPDDPRELFPTRLRQWLGFLPSPPDYWKKIFEKAVLQVLDRDLSKLSKSEQLEALKRALCKGPVMVRIGNGYLPNGAYSKLLATVVGHWITLWGYDDSRELFFVYDSSRAAEWTRKFSPPIGNTVRTYAELLRDMSGGYRSWWAYRYLAVRDQPAPLRDDLD